MRRRSGALAAAAAYTLLAIAMTWPLTRGLTRDLPADFGDPLLNAWILAWDASHMWRALTGQLGALAEYWHANIYYPHPLALAYSEHLTAQALMVLPIYAATSNPVLTYNVLFLATFVLSAIGMFLFVRELTGSDAAAFLGGVAFGFAPYRFGTLAHVQVLSSMWMPFVLLGFHRFLSSGRLAPLAGAAAAWLAQNLSCGYYLLFFSPVVALYLALELTRRRLWSNTRLLLGLAAAGAVVAAGTVPFLLPYLELRQLGFSARSMTETIRFSADVFGYLTADISLFLWGNFVRGFAKPEGSLFPGFTIVLLAAVAFVHQWITARESAESKASSLVLKVLLSLLAVAAALTLLILGGWSLRLSIGGVSVRLSSFYRGLVLIAGLGVAVLALSAAARTTARRLMASPVGTLAVVIAFSIAMSFGPEIQARGRVVEERGLYGLFYDFVPGFDGLRVPARFAMIAALGLAALAGCGAAAVSRRRHGVLAAALATILIVAESWSAPILMNINAESYQQDLVQQPDRLPAAADIPAVYRFVASLPPSAALVELPFGEIAYETRYMYFSTFHWRRLVNGYSGGGPVNYGLWAERLKEILQSPESAWQAVVDSRATHIIVHEGNFNGDRGSRISAWARARGAREIGVFGTDHIFVIAP